jgi:hypothetical protein
MDQKIKSARNREIGGENYFGSVLATFFCTMDLSTRSVRMRGVR